MSTVEILRKFFYCEYSENPWEPKFTFCNRNLWKSGLWWKIDTLNSQMHMTILKKNSHFSLTPILGLILKGEKC